MIISERNSEVRGLSSVRYDVIGLPTILEPEPEPNDAIAGQPHRLTQTDFAPS
jgi:hypothetical protein